MASAGYKVTPSRLRNFQGTTLQYCLLAGLWDFAFDYGGLPDEIVETANLIQLDVDLLATIWQEFVDGCAKTNDGRLMPVEILHQIHTERTKTKALSAAGSKGGKATRADRLKNQADVAGMRHLFPAIVRPESNNLPEASLNGQTNIKTGEEVSVSTIINDLQEARLTGTDGSGFIEKMSGSTTINGLPEARLQLVKPEEQCPVLEESTVCEKPGLNSVSPYIYINNNNIYKGEILNARARESQPSGKRSEPVAAPFDPIDANQPMPTDDLHIALRETFPGHAHETRPLLSLMSYVMGVAGNASDVRRWPKWFGERYPNKAETVMSFRDSFHLMLREKSTWSTGMRFILAVAFGINAKEIVRANNLEQRQLNQARSIGRQLETAIGLPDACDWQKRGFMPAAFLEFWKDKFPNAGNPAPASVIKYWNDFEQWLKLSSN